ncbi:MAG TPA: hypothetical protein VLF59_05580 [Candidatus Saccharimonadales bacterium]|nr:hypothetical protein [Candidatus Saccharimonadales bacterium]
MSGFVIALVFALGGSTWVFTMVQRQSGSGNSRSALIAGGISFVMIFIVVFSVGAMMSHH